MQATVASFDEHDHHGSLLLDDGSSLNFPATAFAASGLRMLRLGQRVTIVVAADGQVTWINIPTMPNTGR